MLPIVRHLDFKTVQWGRIESKLDYTNSKSDRAKIFGRPSHDHREGALMQRITICNLQKSCLKNIFHRIFKIHEKKKSPEKVIIVLLERKCWKIEQQIKVKIEDWREAPW